MPALFFLAILVTLFGVFALFVATFAFAVFAIAVAIFAIAVAAHAQFVIVVHYGLSQLLILYGTVITVTVFSLFYLENENFVVFHVLEVGRLKYRIDRVAVVYLSKKKQFFFTSVRAFEYYYFGFVDEFDLVIDHFFFFLAHIAFLLWFSVCIITDFNKVFNFLDVELNENPDKSAKLS